MGRATFSTLRHSLTYDASTRKIRAPYRVPGGAAARKDNMTGLSGYSLKFNEQAALDTAVAALDRLEIATERQSDGIVLRDPWGIGLKLSA